MTRNDFLRQYACCKPYSQIQAIDDSDFLSMPWGEAVAKVEAGIRVIVGTSTGFMTARDAEYVLQAFNDYLSNNIVNEAGVYGDICDPRHLAEFLVDHHPLSAWYIYPLSKSINALDIHRTPCYCAPER